MIDICVQRHEAILTVLIILIGGLAGYINFLRYQLSSEPSNVNRIRYVLSGIGSAILVPLFLNMLSSSLIKYTKGFDTNNYFVFAGFCFIAGYFSDRFIDSIGDKLLKELQQTQQLVNSTSDKLERTSQDVKDNKEKVDALIDQETELDDTTLNSTIEVNELKNATELVDDGIPEKMHNIINVFKGEYKFRTVNGIAKELKYPSTIVEMILNSLEKQGAAKRFTQNDNKILWSLTKIGQLMRQP